MGDSTSAEFHRILLTGGTGFVGGHLLPAIEESFRDAKKILLSRPGEIVDRPHWETVYFDLGDLPEMERFVARQRPDLVIHLAAQSSIGEAAENPEETRRVNLLGTVALASACVKYVPDLTFLFVSSGEVYGQSFSDGFANETTILSPMNAYAQSKADAECALPDALGASAKLIVARPFNHTGPGQSTRFVLPSFAMQIAEMEAGRLPRRLSTGNIDGKRDFLDVRDVCDAYIGLLRISNHLPRVRELGKLQSNVFNIASGNAYRLRDLVEFLQTQARVSFEIAVDPLRQRRNDLALVGGSNSRIRDLTGWRPQIKIETTLRELLEYSRAVVALSPLGRAAN